MTTTPEQKNAATTPVGTLEHLDPHSVALEDNVRDAAGLDAEFLASITEHGVLQPVTAVRAAEGVLVRDGQRRTLAARQAGLATMPVYILDAPDADGVAAAAERIAHQIVTNDQRAALTDAQRVRGIQRMLDAGLSATRVAQKLSVPRDTVKAAARAAGSTSALDALDTGQLSLTEAAAVTEFIVIWTPPPQTARNAARQSQGGIIRPQAAGPPQDQPDRVLSVAVCQSVMVS